MNIEVSREVLDEVEHITGTLPGKVYYSADGEVLILCDEGKYIISVEPPDPPFNNGNPPTHSAYLYAEPPTIDNHGCFGDLDVSDGLAGWSTGWEC